MIASLLAAVVMAVVAAAGAWFAPAVIRALPEPEPRADERDADLDQPAKDEHDADPDQPVKDAAAVDPPKPLYADLAARRGLARNLAIVAAVTAGTVGWTLGPDPSLPMWAFLSVAGVTLSYVDWRTRLLPFRLVAPAYPVMVVLAVVAALLAGGDWDALVRVGIAWVVVYAVFTLMWLVYRRGLGYGDVRLSGVLAIGLGWLGWAQVVIGMYAAFLAGAIVGIVLAALKIVDRKAYPFGPFLLFGAWFGVVFGTPLAAALGWAS